MAPVDFLPIVTNNLSTFFPGLKHYILCNASRIQTIKKNKTIIFANNEELFYLANGTIKAYMIDASGHEKLTYIFEKDTIIFHSFSNQYYKTLVAANDVVVFYIDQPSVSQFLQTDSKFIDQYILLIKERYGILLRQVLTGKHQSAKQKVLSFLISLANNFGVPEENTLVINEIPSLTDLAALINVHRTNVSTYINELEKMQIIERQKKALIIKDLQALQRKLDETEAE